MPKVSYITHAELSTQPDLWNISPIMNLQEITEKIRRFRDERDWAQFHSPKDMAMALSIEAAEYPTEKVRGSSLKYNEYCD